jgi:hypothetical protein
VTQIQFDLSERGISGVESALIEQKLGKQGFFTGAKFCYVEAKNPGVKNKEGTHAEPYSAQVDVEQFYRAEYITLQNRFSSAVIRWRTGQKRMKESKSYIIGYAILQPLRWLKKLFVSIFRGTTD